MTIKNNKAKAEYLASVLKGMCAVFGQNPPNQLEIANNHLGLVAGMAIAALVAVGEGEGI
jgi:hypothetical protein